MCCYDIEFESDFIVILHCFMYSTVVNICCINMCLINKVNIERSTSLYFLVGSKSSLFRASLTLNIFLFI